MLKRGFMRGLMPLVMVRTRMKPVMMEKVLSLITLGWKSGEDEEDEEEWKCADLGHRIASHCHWTQLGGR